jgi:hypothetical protein
VLTSILEDKLRACCEILHCLRYEHLGRLRQYCDSRSDVDGDELLLVLPAALVLIGGMIALYFVLKKARQQQR